MYLPCDHPIEMHLLLLLSRNAAQSYGKGKKGKVEVLFNEENGEVQVRDFGRGFSPTEFGFDGNLKREPLARVFTLGSPNISLAVVWALSEYCTFTSFYEDETWTLRSRPKAAPLLVDDVLDSRGGTVVTFKPKDAHLKGRKWNAKQAARVLAGIQPEHRKITFSMRAIRDIELIP